MNNENILRKAFYTCNFQKNVILENRPSTLSGPEYGRSLDEALRDDLSGDFRDLMRGLVAGGRQGDEGDLGTPDPDAATRDAQVSVWYREWIREFTVLGGFISARGALKNLLYK